MTTPKDSASALFPEPWNVPRDVLELPVSGQNLGAATHLEDLLPEGQPTVIAFLRHFG